MARLESVAPDNAGAFTPGCSKTHLPGYVGDYDKLTAAGAQLIACVSSSASPSTQYSKQHCISLDILTFMRQWVQVTVNDPFVTAAWGEANHADGKVNMLADMHIEFTKVRDLALAGTADDTCMLYLGVVEKLSTTAAGDVDAVTGWQAGSDYASMQGMGLVLDAEGMLGSKRSKRFAEQWPLEWCFNRRVSSWHLRGAMPVNETIHQVRLLLLQVLRHR